MFADLNIHVQHVTTSSTVTTNDLLSLLKSNLRNTALHLHFDPFSAPPASTFSDGNKKVVKENNDISTNCFIFCDKTLDETRGHPWRYSFSFERGVSWTGVGAGMKDRVIELRPNWPWSSVGHGTYVFGYNNWRLHHTDKLINDKGGSGVTIKDKDELVCWYDTYNKTLHCKNVTTGAEDKMADVPGNAHVMVVLFGNGNEITIKKEDKFNHSVYSMLLLVANSLIVHHAN